MGVASHLGIRLSEYDQRIRTFIPHYEDMLDAAAAAVASLARSRPLVVDLGTGSGALAGRVIRTCPGARVTGIDADEGMLGLAKTRVGGKLTTLTGDFLSATLPRCDAVTASFSLHHVATRKAKAAMYARCATALKKGGVFVNADCCLSMNRTLQARDRAAWHAHLAQRYGRAGAEGYLNAWADEDFYFTLDDEIDLLTRAGLEADVVWRRDSFAVIAATK